MIRRVAWERVLAAGAAILAGVVLRGVDAIVVLAVVIAILVVAVAAETARLREVRAQVKAG